MTVFCYLYIIIMFWKWSSATNLIYSGQLEFSVVTDFFVWLFKRQLPGSDGPTLSRVASIGCGKNQRRWWQLGRQDPQGRRHCLLRFCLGLCHRFRHHHPRFEKILKKQKFCNHSGAMTFSIATLHKSKQCKYFAQYIKCQCTKCCTLRRHLQHLL